jgi:ATP-dependent Lon protease
MSTLRGGAPAPHNPFPILPLRNGVVFPGTVLTLPVGRERSVALLRTLHPGDIVGIVAQKKPRDEDPSREDLHDVGTYARITELTRVGTTEYRLGLEGLDRFALGPLVRRDPFWLADGTLAESRVTNPREAELLRDALRARIGEIEGRAGGALASPFDDDPSLFADQVAAALGLPADKEMAVLAELDVAERLRLVARLLGETVELADVKKKIEGEVRKEIGKSQREALLREQLRAIQRELGDTDRGGDVDKLKEKLERAEPSEEAREVIARELRRLEAMGAQSPEAHVIRNYLELIAELPWNRRADAKDDLDAIARKLDEDHFGLADVKKRILEHMAVVSLTSKGAELERSLGKGAILCFAGPPGVGKTSLGQSIADATGRPLVRVSLGGVGDEAELRGHRRTYVGALPGRILGALKKAKVKNPVLLLDEVDKLGFGFRGSPEAALLEILDPEQNKSFNDHYLEIPFDLSEVMFLCTANDLGNLSAPLRDRLEIIELSGYTADEKVHIGKQHLVPRAIREHAIPDGALTVTDAAIGAIVRDYTREAGVRQLGRELGKLARAVALEVARAKDEKVRIVVDEADVARHLGKVRFFSDVAERTATAGVATGLAWTPVGGDILFIETSRMRGKGAVEITGQLGDVMKESAKAALTYVRSHADELGVDAEALGREDIHIHVPAGAVPKDGPSAGVTMFTALTSLLTGRRVRPDTAMTGEVTLRGRVLPVGGIKAKVLAAHRAGITRVVLPAKNARDLDDVPARARDAMEFILADDMREVLAAALEPVPDASRIDVTGSVEGLRGREGAAAPVSTEPGKHDEGAGDARGNARESGPADDLAQSAA